MKKLTTEEFIKKAKEKFGDNYDYSESEYKGSNEFIKIKCNKCNKVFLQLAKHHLYDKAGCPSCGKKRNTKGHKAKKLTTEEFIKKAKEKFGDNYDYNLVNYVETNIKIKIKCNKCNKTFSQTPHNHLLEFVGCDCSLLSKGEEKIKTILNNQNMLFEEQKKFNSLRDKQLLSYDFFLEKENLLIEYNGKQHYKSIDKWGGRKRFLLQKHHDWLKRKYAKDNGYNLLIIPYWEFKNIEKILGNYL